MSLDRTLVIEIVECNACGVEFGLTARFERARRLDHAVFYCPSGHPLRFLGETEEERLRKELTKSQEALSRSEARVRLRAQELTDEQRAHATTKGVLTRTRKRISNGTCPFCHRHFANVELHMASVHTEAEE